MQQYKYESTIKFYIDSVPPFQSKKNPKVLNDFKDVFHSRNVYESWIKENKNTILRFNDFALTKLIDRYELSINPKERLIFFLPITNHEGELVIKTNNLQLLNEVLSYAKYSNSILLEKYFERINEETSVIDNRFKNSVTDNNFIVQELLNLDRFIVSTKKNKNIINFKPPTIPKKHSKNSTFILLLSLLIGLMTGCLFVFFRSAYLKKK